MDYLGQLRKQFDPAICALLLSLSGRTLAENWQVRAMIALAIPVLLELGQLLYYRFSTGRYVGSFDPLDIVMSTISVVLAVLAERKVFAKLF